MGMGTRIKLRVCTWNVGNAQPPVDLKQWLGIGEDDYDLIAVGAQEANFGSDKTIAQATVSVSPKSTTSTSKGMDFPPMSPCTPGPPVAPPSSRRFRRLGKVFGRFSRSSSSRRGKELDGSPENGDLVGIPKSRSTFPLTGVHSLIEVLSRGKSLEANDPDDEENQDIPTMTLLNFTDRARLQADMDESLSMKHEQNVSEALESISLNDPLGKMFISGGSLSEECGKENVNLTLEGLKELCVEDNGPATEGGDPRQRRSKMFRHTATKALRAGEDMLEKGNDNEDIGTNAVSGSVKKFSQVVEKNIPSEYHLIAKHHLMEIKLLLFIHERHRSRVTKTEAVTEATGIGNVVGNKGAVAVKVTLDDTSFCFVCCHLAAHEGAKFLLQRNCDVIDIMRNIEKNKVYGLPVMHQFNHIFWMGDLNYRLDVKDVVPAGGTWTHEEKFGYVSDLIMAGRYEELTGFDELRREMGEGNVFGGFTEGKLEFAPTFKVARGKVREYQELRVPSYCDRILWHSLPLHRKHIKLCEYGCVESIDTSDHKPVYGTFELVIPDGVKIYPMPAPRDCLKCTMDFLKLNVVGLYEKRVENDDACGRYEVDDGGMSVSSSKGENSEEKSGNHTRRVVTATFHGNGMFLREKPVRIEVPLRAGKREARYEELPAIAIRPVGSLNDLRYKYVTIVFARLGSRQGSSCILPFAKMVQKPGRHRVSTELELMKYGMGIAKVSLVVELVVSLETWIDTRNNVVRARLK